MASIRHTHNLTTGAVRGRCAHLARSIPIVFGAFVVFHNAQSQVAIKFPTPIASSGKENFVPSYFHGPDPGEGIRRTTVVEESGHTWLLTDQVYRIAGAHATLAPLGKCYELEGGKSKDGKEGTRIFRDLVHYHVTAFQPFHGRWYVGTDHGLFALAHGEVKPISYDAPCETRSVAYKSDSPDTWKHDVSHLWRFDGHLWFKASDFGVGRLTDDDTAHAWGDTNAWTTLIGRWDDSLFVLTYFKDGELLVRLSNQESPNPRDSLKGLGQGTRITFLNAQNQPSTFDRKIYQVSRVRDSSWIIASDGVYLLLGDRAYRIAEPPPVAQASNAPDGIPPAEFEVEKPILIEDATREERTGNGRRMSPRDCRSNKDCSVGIAIDRIASRNRTDLEKLARSSSAEKMAIWNSESIRSQRESSETDATSTGAPSSEAEPWDQHVAIVISVNGHEETKNLNELPIRLSLPCNDESRLIGLEDIDGIYLWEYQSRRAYLVFPGHYDDIAFGIASEMISAVNEAEQSDVTKSANSECSAFIFTERGTFRLHGHGAKTVISKEITNSGSYDVVPIRLSGKDHYLFLASGGVFEFDQGRVEHIQSNALPSAILAQFQRGGIDAPSVEFLPDPAGSLWLATAGSVFLFRGDEKRFDRVPERELSSPRLMSVAGRTWIIAENEVDKVYEKARLVLSLEDQDVGSVWKQFVHGIAGPGTFVSGTYNVRMRYDDVGSAEHLDERFADSRFDFIGVGSAKEFLDRVSNDRYSAEGTPLTLDAGAVTLYVKLKDAYANTFYSERSLSVWPSAYVLPLIICAIWIAGAFSMVLLAPYSRFLHMALMNDRLRTFGSFGIVPILLTVFPFMQKHLLRRMRRAIAADGAFLEAATVFVPPASEFRYEQFSRELVKHRKVLLLGKSGLGKTTFFRYLCLNWATRPSGSLRSFVPVYVPLSRYQTLNAVDTVVAQLENYGEIHDRDLASWFLRQGGFVIFLDGLNEISDTARAELNVFLDSVSRRNVICVSSQVKYEEFNWLSTVSLVALNDMEIRTVMERTLSPIEVSKFLSQMDDQIREVYSVPQNLTLAAEIVKAGQNLPRTRYQLYKEVFEPIEEHWISQGSGELAGDLYERAFEMLARRLPFLDSGGFDTPTMAVTDLTARKLLARSGLHFVFTHDLVRAFFAANHFLLFWKDPARIWAKVPDRNWLPMLEFCLSEFTSSTEAALLLDRLSKTNIRVAGEVFRVLRAQYPTLVVASTEELFLRRYAEASLTE